METSKADQDMLNEIKAYVAAKQRAQKKSKKEKILDPDSPYLIDLVKQLPAEYLTENDTAQTKARTDARIKKAALKNRKPQDPDEILNYYASLQRKPHGVPKEDVAAKALTLPFGDAVMKINEFVGLDKSLRSNELSFNQYNTDYISNKPPAPLKLRSSASPSPLRASPMQHPPSPGYESAPYAETKTETVTIKSRFHRKYPRLCKSFRFTDADIDNIGTEQKRSDYWMARFLEECFDEAYITCNTPVSKEIKWRLRNGLDLGSLDCFPKVVERLLSVRYSTLEIRTQVCLEFLCGLEQLLKVSEAARVAELPESATAVQQMGEDVYDGERAQMFSKFLSEEYDLDYLAMFLQTRETLQKAFRFRLKDLNQARIWLDDKDDTLLEKEQLMTATTYYRVQQLSKTAAVSSPVRSATAVMSKSMVLGEKRKFAWSAEALSMSSKMETRSGRRKSSLAGSKDDEAVEFGARTANTNVGTGKRSALSTSASVSDFAATASSKRVRSSANLSATGGTQNTAASAEFKNETAKIEDSLHKPAEGKKVVPVTLPNSWHFLHDLTMPEAPIVGFETGLVSLVCMHLLPRCAQAVRTYLTDKVIAMTKASLMDTVAAVRDLANDSSILDATGRVSVSTARDSFAAGKVVKIVPLYILLKTLCVEWKKLSLETKVSFIESGAGSASLKSLNVIYQDDSAMMKQLEDEIGAVQKDLGAAQARILGLEKNLRRLERRRLACIVSPEELDAIEEARIQLDNDVLSRMELESKDAALQKRKKELEQRVEDLWRKATLNSLPITVDKRRKKFKAKLKQSIADVAAEKKVPTAEEELAQRHSDWRAVVSDWLIKVVVTNLDEDTALKRSVLQKLEKDRMDQEAARRAAEERAAAEAEAEERRKQAMEQQQLKRSADIHTPGPTQRYFILEVLAKVVVRTALRDGLRRASLREYLRIQEHRLLLVYGSSEYKRKDRERLQREKDERDQRRRYLLRVQMARLMSGGIVNETMDEAKARAELLLFDPWSLLDLNPSSWLSPLVIRTVEDLFEQRKAAYEHKCLMFLFHHLKRAYGIKKLRNKLNRRTCKLVLRSIWRDMMGARHLNACARRIQHAIRCMVYRVRFRRHLARLQQSNAAAIAHDEVRLQNKSEKYFLYWRMQCNLKYRCKKVVAALKDRRFILTFYIWRDQFKKHKFARISLNAEQLRACMSLQGAVRCAVARRRFKALWARKKIGGLVRQYFARERVRRERENVRRLQDFSASVSYIQQDHELRRHFQAWKRSRNVLEGLRHVNTAVEHDKMRRRFAKWLNLAQYRTKRLAKRVIKIQAVGRMWLAQHFVLHYYRWRRGLVAFQSIYRMRLCVRQYEYDIFFYRAAKRIQKLFRGYRCRIHLNDQRVLDIHYAASHNNYDRLKYYVEKFPELITLPDPEGNNALHSAAKNACKRTLKLLMKHNFLNPNVRNAAGYTALHLTIASVAPARDDCYMYMMERGFSDEVHGPDGKSTLLIAAEYGRTIIVRHLLVEEDHNPNIADSNGTTSLQTACWQGNVAMVRDLIDNEADVNMPGYNGTFPLHDVVYSGSVEIAKMLLSHGAYVNVYEPYNYQTPLMFACAAGMGEIARLYLIQGAEVNAKDTKGQSAVHHGVASNSADVYNALREADADFDSQDLQGDSPLHLAAESGAAEFAISILHGGGYPSWQNSRGDQPAHIAARYNQLELLKQICRYDEHIGRVNYEHQTPLGVAKFHLAKECQVFLTKHYRMVEVQNGRNKIGELWWDKEIDDAVGDWEVSVTASGERFYINRKTAEVTMQPPSMSANKILKTAQKAELPLHRTVTIVKEENTLTKHAYYLDYAEKEKDVAEIAKDYVNATIIVKYARRKLAYLELQRLKDDKKQKKNLTRFIKRHLPGFMMWRRFVYTRSAIRIQAAWRGRRLRKRYFRRPEGEYYQRRRAKAQWRLRYKLWAMWKFYISRSEFKMMRLNRNQPQTLADWQVIIDDARRPKRKVGMYEEYLYPGTHNIFFYRHALTGLCSFEKPKKMKFLDEAAMVERHQIKKYGATAKQIGLAVKMQAMWRGYQVRTYSKYVARAMQISLHAENRYLSNPDVDANLYNYALHCFVGLQDIARARRAFVEALRRMQWRGPDLPFVLYSYSIFALVARDEDYADVMLLLTRARQAEEELDEIKRKKLGVTESTVKSKGNEFRHGKSYDLANTGFFRHLAVQSHNSFGWEAFAVCRFLVYRDFNSSFDAFMEAFRFAPEDQTLMENFNIMMTHFHGKSKQHRDEVIKKRMQYLAQIDADKQEIMRQRREYAQLRRNSAKRIQDWFKKCKENRIFYAFMEGVRNIIKRRQRQVASQQRSRGLTGHSTSTRSQSNRLSSPQLGGAWDRNGTPQSSRYETATPSSRAHGSPSARSMGRTTSPLRVKSP